MPRISADRRSFCPNDSRRISAGGTSDTWMASTAFCVRSAGVLDDDQAALLELHAEVAQIVLGVFQFEAVLAGQRGGGLLDAAELLQQLQHVAAGGVHAVVL